MKIFLYIYLNVYFICSILNINIKIIYLNFLLNVLLQKMKLIRLWPRSKTTMSFFNDQKKGIHYFLYNLITYVLFVDLF